MYEYISSESPVRSRAREHLCGCKSALLLSPCKIRHRAAQNLEPWTWLRSLIGKALAPKALDRHNIREKALPGLQEGEEASAALSVPA